MGHLNINEGYVAISEVKLDLASAEIFTSYPKPLIILVKSVENADSSSMMTTRRIRFNVCSPCSTTDLVPFAVLGLSHRNATCHLSAMESGQIELMPSADWYRHGWEFNLQRITGGWNEKRCKALAKGFVGMRVSGNAFWIGTSNWKEFCAYEQELDQSLADQAMIVLCTYSLSQSRIFDLLDVARAHQFTVIRRKGEWEILETPDLKQAKREIRKLNAALNVLSSTFPGHETLTSRERVVLTQIVRGFSSKEIARTLGITPRTVEFHRANLLKKTNARNTVDLVRIALGK